MIDLILAIKKLGVLEIDEIYNNMDNTPSSVRLLKTKIKKVPQAPNPDLSMNFYADDSLVNDSEVSLKNTDQSIIKEEYIA